MAWVNRANFKQDCMVLGTSANGDGEDLGAAAGQVPGEATPSPGGPILLASVLGHVSPPISPAAVA